MPKDPTKPDPTPTPEPPKPQDPVEVDFSKLSDEQLAKALEDPRLWKTQRLAELRKDAAELKKLKDAQEADEKKRLEEEGKTAELLEKTKQELDAAKQKLVDQAKAMKIATVAQAKGIKDVDAAGKLLDQSQVTIDDNGEVQGVEGAIDALIKGRPYLVQAAPGVNTPTNPDPNVKGTTEFKMSQVVDPKFYQEHHEEIIRAQGEGRIVEDRPGFAPPVKTE